MGYPTGPLLKTLSERILANMSHIEDATKHYEPTHTQPPFSDTQLLISLLGVLVFPHERASDALGNILASFPNIRNVVDVKYNETPGGSWYIDDKDGQTMPIDPSEMKNLIRLLRNSIAHFNIRPIEESGSFAGIRIWNERKKRITMVADIRFRELRPLALYVLKELAASGLAWEVSDPEDPMEILKREGRLT